jgi:hypothetical protein
VSDHPESIPRYPLAWPLGWVRTRLVDRQRSPFTQKLSTVTGEGLLAVSTARYGPVTLRTAVDRLEQQIDALGGQDPTLSTNLQVRIDGAPRGGQAEPADPGAACYFRFKGRATVLACDRYRRVAENIAALAAHIDALRRIERYGVGTIEQALAGYKALPADSAADWRAVFGLGRHELVSPAVVQRAYKELAALAHPDKPGGSDDRMTQLNRAREFALQELLG